MSDPARDPAAEHLARRRIWEAKYAIRACYRGWFERLQPWIVPGPAVEIGAGSGQMKDFWPELIATDLVETPFVDLVADGMRLPLADGSLGNLLAIDLLHHLADPRLFFDEATRVLRPGGRVLAIEPYITPASWLGYRLMHHEDVWFGGYHRTGPDKGPWEGNMAIPNLLFSRERAAWARRHPRLGILELRRFSFFDFQLAGGFKQWAFVSSPRLYDLFRRADRLLDPFGPLLGFRIACVIERRP